MKPSYDLVVIGAGTAGCVVAARASEDPTQRILLVEAGPDPRPVPEEIADPSRQAELVAPGSPWVRRYEVRRPDGSTFALASGRVVGGGSAVNNLAVVRPPRRDFERWAQVGGPAWSYESMLPLMRGVEHDPDFPDDPLHGTGGPLELHRPFRLDGTGGPVVGALLEAGAGLGLPPCDDLHVPEPEGVCASPYSIRAGRRLSTATAWLDPARVRPNLAVAAGMTVVRLEVAGGRIRGIRVVGPRGPERIEAAEVILAAGSFHSPQLLMLSGIGPADALESQGIRVVHDLAGVGANYQDHAVVQVAFEPGPRVAAGQPIPKARLIARSDARLEHPDLHVLLRPVRAATGGRPVLPVSIHLLEHRTAGRVSLAGPDPAHLPRVEPGLLEHPDDVRALVDGIGLAARVAGHPALVPYVGPLIEPSGGDIRAYVLASYDSYHHGTGTCRMGPPEDPGAVVDGRLRVHGVENLRIADASVLPSIPRANTNLAAILVGEFAARELGAV